MENMEMSLTDLSAAQFRRAAEIKEQVEELHRVLSTLLGEVSVAAKRRRAMSAAARARIAASQKARWAKLRIVRVHRFKRMAARRMSAAGRKRLSEIAKARWAKAKARGKSRL
jgi:hypothetical protein